MNSAKTETKKKAPSYDDLNSQVIIMKGKVKGAFKIIDMLHARENDNIKAIEETICMNPTHTYLHDLLLNILERNCKDKAVASYQVYDKEKKIWITQSLHKGITTNGDWKVSLVRDGTVVRVHLKDDAKKNIATDRKSVV